MKVCYLCFRAFSFARTTSITAGSMELQYMIFGKSNKDQNEKKS